MDYVPFSQIITIESNDRSILPSEKSNV